MVRCLRKVVVRQPVMSFVVLCRGFVFTCGPVKQSFFVFFFFEFQNCMSAHYVNARSRILMPRHLWTHTYTHVYIYIYIYIYIYMCVCVCVCVCVCINTKDILITDKTIMIIIMKGTGGLGSWRTSGDHHNNCIIENTEKSPGDLRRLAVTQTPEEDNQR